MAVEFKPCSQSSHTKKLRIGSASDAAFAKHSTKKKGGQRMLVAVIEIQSSGIGAESTAI